MSAPQGTPAEDTSARRASAMSDDSIMDEIEAELQAQQGGGPGGHPPMMGGGAPNHHQMGYPDLPPHAEEFWFPECRNCTCCNGFKHGCSCASANGGVCRSCSGVSSSTARLY